jgi:methanogenic corrinoid protein MtbC1
MNDDLIVAMAELDEDKVLDLVKEKISGGQTALSIIEQCRKGVERVGEQYSNGAYYLSDLIMSEEIFKEVTEITLLNESGLQDRAIVILGGYPVNEEIREYTGADYCTNDANKVITIFQEASEGLDTKVLIGGNYVDDFVKEHVGADYAAKSASDALKVAGQIFG